MPKIGRHCFGPCTGELAKGFLAVPKTDSPEDAIIYLCSFVPGGSRNAAPVEVAA
ncbi:hypothetical protein [Flavobacterium album]|uniref:hypothetical protein n=1 Tax=Flavobacterium album TaxID=2175091 RepID=UPI0015E81137|nr:hypothetical protein [Flavobacterium album]